MFQELCFPDAVNRNPGLFAAEAYIKTKNLFAANNAKGAKRANIQRVRVPEGEIA
jgi:hypothetical protein